MSKNKATIAIDIGGVDGLWKQSAVKLAEDVPHYRKEGGEPNFDHMVTVAHQLGHSEINADNLAQVIQELKDRVNAPATDPAPDGSEPTTVPETEPTPVDEEELVEACAELPEAPVVAWTDIISPEGFRWCVTVRAGLPDDLARQAVTKTIDLAKTVERGALAAGWHAPGNGNGQSAAQPLTQATMPPVASTPPIAGEGGNGNLTFQAEALVANVSEGNVYWKVKGGKYKQWGVTIWPEVLAGAGFEPDSLDPTKTYNLNGYTAQYITNDSGNPQKVTGLEKV